MRAGLNGRQLADRLGLRPNTYRQIESGRRQLKFEMAVQISEILGCDLSELIGNHGDLVAAEKPSKQTQYLSVYGKSTILNSDEVAFLDTGTVIPKPDGVSETAYAVRVYNAKAGPRFEVGDLLICDPTLPMKPNQWAVIGIKRGDRTIAEIHRVKEIDSESQLILLANDKQLKLKICSSIDVIVAIHPS